MGLAARRLAWRVAPPSPWRGGRGRRPRRTRAWQCDRRAAANAYTPVYRPAYAYHPAYAPVYDYAEPAPLVYRSRVVRRVHYAPRRHVVRRVVHRRPLVRTRVVRTYEAAPVYETRVVRRVVPVNRYAYEPYGYPATYWGSPAVSVGFGYGRTWW